MSETDLAYIAGFFDGEGHCGVSLQVSKTYRSYHCNVLVTNTNREVLDWMQKTLQLGFVKIAKPAKAHHKVSYRLEFPKLHIVKFLGFVLPYLKVKKRQAELMIQFCAIDFEQRDLQRSIHSELSELNKRGTF